MQDKSFLVVANWKMQLSLHQELQYATLFQQPLIDLGHKTSIVLCPSTAALFPIAQLFNGSPVAIGAQNCSEFEQGPYTGQESALSLQQAGCTFCIIGHSEYRTYAHETDLVIAHKLIRLINEKICPIICIGETKEEYTQGKTAAVLATQLKQIGSQLHANSVSIPICIAYEPIWSVGTGVIPPLPYLETIYTLIKALCIEYFPHCTITLLYGGSVNENNVQDIITVNHINGLLLGGASLDFQKFKNIVLLSSM